MRQGGARRARTRRKAGKDGQVQGCERAKEEVLMCTNWATRKSLVPSPSYLRDRRPESSTGASSLPESFKLSHPPTGRRAEAERAKDAGRAAPSPDLVAGQLHTTRKLALGETAKVARINGGTKRIWQSLQSDF